MTSLRARVRLTIGDGRIVALQRRLAPAARRNLTALARLYDTDKARGHAYTGLYEEHFRSLRDRPIRLLEIGIGGYDSPTWGGASLRMWRDYFRYGEIHGLDIAEKRIEEPRIRIHRGDQSDVEFMRRLGTEHGPFDIVIDDGSHVGAHILASFEALFVHCVRPGGWYVIEDMATAYLPAYGGGPPGCPGTSVALVRDLVDDVNRRHCPTRTDVGQLSTDRAVRPVAAVHTYDEIAFIRRAS